ncbi:MAG: UbiX family flavin prenyltransferase [Archaeoglobaceae archaeon]|nr:UbiX family flavin prenyltransferase [Archaeoglobaceae archaeon]
MRLVVALTGASGQIYGIRALEMLKNKVETHLIISNSAKITIEVETEYSIEYIKSLADRFYEENELKAPISSGSFKHNGMLIAPCSIKTAASIAYSITNNLITRAADVCLKEGRKLVLLVRETPLHYGHLKMLARLAKIGATIMPPIPAFYTKPRSIEDIVNNTVSRALEILGIEVDYPRWG